MRRRVTDMQKVVLMPALILRCGRRHMSSRSSTQRWARVFYMTSWTETTLANARRTCSSVDGFDVRQDGLRVASTAPVSPAVSPLSQSTTDGYNTNALLAGVTRECELLRETYGNLLEDRRAQYRDAVLRAPLLPIQRRIQSALQKVLEFHPLGNGTGPFEVGAEGVISHLTAPQLREWKERWMRQRGAPAQPHSGESRDAFFRELRLFYSTLLSSGLLSRESEVRLVMTQMQDADLVEPDATFYESLFLALWSLTEVQRAPAAVDKSSPTAEATVPPLSTSEIVAGEVAQLRRAVVGDLAGHYMGHALAQSVPLVDAPRPRHVPVRYETWELFFITLAHVQPAPKLVDLWWSRFVVWLDACEELTVMETGAAVPYRVVHAILAWCAQSREMKRGLQYFSAVNKRGLMLHSSTTVLATASPELHDFFSKPGSLTAISSNEQVQRVQLSLLVKLMASTKSVTMDGGLRALVVRDIQRQISPAVLHAAPWAVINDLLAGLSVPSAMQLVRHRSCTKLPVQNDPALDGSGTMTKAPAQAHQHTRNVPFYIWASLLRRCCREHLQDEAESLFGFIRQTFALSALEKRELVEIMIRMFTTMHPADFSSAVYLFVQHVVRSPAGEPALKPDAVLYELLVKSADSRSAAMMVFLEACANGVVLTEELFDALMGSTQLSTMVSLSRKLPYDYTSSSLDAQLTIPADVDAHLRREEALQARGKPLYDSTGDAG